MQRGFLFGIGSLLIVGAITGLGFLLSQDFLGGVSLALICIPLSVVVIRAVKSAPPNRGEQKPHCLCDNALLRPARSKESKSAPVPRRALTLAN